MNIRPAEKTDIPAIVALLKLSLGELIPKSEDYWRWKHIDNPFGISPVLLAFENDRLVGIRAFMRWKWQVGRDVYETVRAVDTATHPDHLRKGIFSKLTLMLLEQCKKEGVDFVFNTPNQSSKPGYLKMGWEVAGKLPVSIKCKKPVSIIMHAAGLKTNSHTAISDNSSLTYFLDSPKLEGLLIKDRANQPYISTQLSVQFLRWRYKHVKVVDYFAAGLETNDQLRALVLYRIKPGKAGNELRVTDVFVESKNFRKEVAIMLNKRVESHNVEYLTVSATHRWIFTGFMSLSSLKVGPIVTIRNLENGPMERLLGFREWSPSLGDLELF